MQENKFAFVGKLENHNSFNNQLIELSETSVKYDALTAAKIVEDLQSDDNNMPIQILHKCGQTTKQNVSKKKKIWSGNKNNLLLRFLWYNVYVKLIDASF